MKIVLAIAILLVAGCTTAPVKKQADPRCVDVASFARGMAVLKQMGVAEQDVDAFTTHPAIATFPIRLIRHSVYAQDNAQPNVVFKQALENCQAFGYENLLEVYK